MRFKKIQQKKTSPGQNLKQGNGESAQTQTLIRRQSTNSYYFHVNFQSTLIAHLPGSPKEWMCFRNTKQTYALLSSNANIFWYFPAFPKAPQRSERALLLSFPCFLRSINMESVKQGQIDLRLN